ncbi:MAG TPA: hypothetical protein VL947_12200, partial [Cytophagales bacterium]|nr:hypothetical protein [Cytophagales bacterium]
LGNGRYFFNGFYNYHLSTVFFSFGNSGTNKPGYLQGFETDRTVQGLLPLGGNFFALSKSDYGNYELLPRVQLNTADNQYSSSEALQGFKLPELKNNTGIKIKRLVIKGKDVLVYISDTKGKQIVLYFYDAQTGVLLATKYLGTSNPFEAGGVLVTSQNGLIIIGTCYVGGRYPKICYFSLTENQLPL